MNEGEISLITVLRFFFFLFFPAVFLPTSNKNLKKKIHTALQTRRFEKAATGGPGHSHREDLQRLEVSHTLLVNEKKPDCDCCLVQAIRSKILSFLAQWWGEEFYYLIWVFTFFLNLYGEGLKEFNFVLVFKH